jgi:hypothetical protein
MLNGFVILSHQDARQLGRLVRALNEIYDTPPIACHHDTSQASLEPADFPDNVTFVLPSFRTGWGKFSVVEASLASLQQLYDKADPDWFTLLSASDYPTAPAAQVRSELSTSGADVLIDFREPGMGDLEAAGRFGARNPMLGHFEAAGNRQMTPRRYLAAQLWFPVLRRSASGARLGRHTISLPFRTPFHPFTREFRCYYGDHWFAGSRRAATALLNSTPRERRLQTYLRRRACADECYYQTVLCNRPELTIQRDSRRFAMWNGGGGHPKTLDSGDLDAILASGAHFARKFAPGDAVLDRLDEVLRAQAAVFS